MNILLDLGITNYNNRKIARDHGLLQSHLSGIVPLKFLLSIVYAAFVFGSGWIIGYSTVQFKLLAVLVINQFLSSFILYFRSNISGIQLFRTDSLLSVLDRTLMIIINGVLLWSGLMNQPFRIEWFVYAQTSSYLITFIVVLSVVLYHSGKFRITFNRQNFMVILRQSYPFAILILLMSLFNRVDSVMMERMLADGKEQAGIYAQSFRVLDALSQFSLLFAGLLLPMFSKMIKTGENTDDLIRIASSLLISVAVSVAMAGLFFNKEIIHLMYGDSPAISPLIFSILMFGYIFISLSYIYGTLLTANNSLKALNILAAVTVLINVSLNIVLIPQHKALGAAIASLASQSFYAISQAIIARRVLKVSLHVILYLRILLFAAVVLFTGWVLEKNLHWLNAFIVFIPACMILSVFTGIIKPRGILKIFREA